jgi:hypothetical protein
MPPYRSPPPPKPQKIYIISTESIYAFTMISRTFTILLYNANRLTWLKKDVICLLRKPQ